MSNKSPGRRRQDAASSKARQVEVERDPRWAAIVARDTAADGGFLFSVETTGVYCRPSCGARRAKTENVRFHLSPAAAKAAGFRPCKRCKPDDTPIAQRQADAVSQLCRMIETADEAPTLRSLARALGASASHTQRMFKAVTGLTPRAYGAAHRTRRVQAELARSNTVTAAIYSAGFNSSGRFYEASTRMLGMTPTEFRAGAATLKIRFAVGDCSLGAVLVAQTERGLCAILLGDDPEELLRDLQRRFPRATLVGGDLAFEQVVAAVIGLVERPQHALGLPLDIRGTIFQQRVWQELRQVQSGTTTSYGELARRIGAPTATRAVAQACAANPLAIAVPCHRVVRTDGALSGYRWGLERKRELLLRESQREEARLRPAPPNDRAR